MESTVHQGTLSPAAEGSSPVRKERRRVPRFLCCGRARVQANGSDVWLDGNLADVSLHGCYIEMPMTFPAGNPVNLEIELFGIRACMTATVRVSYAFLGMGFCFGDLEPGQQTQLEQLLSKLVGERALQNNCLDLRASVLPEFLASADPAACFDALIEFFQHNPSLSRDEFYQIAKRVRRS